MPRKGVLPFVVLAIILSAANVQASFWTNAARDEMQIFSLVNATRAKRPERTRVGRSACFRRPRLFCPDVTRQFLEHEDRSGRTAMDRALQAGIRGWRRIGENLFFCEGADEIPYFAVNGWMESPSHRDNILDRKWTTTGVGIFRGRNGRVYITEMFIQE